MSKLPSLITNELTGEAINYSYDSDNLIKLSFLQKFQVVQDTKNFKWKVKSQLFVKMDYDNNPDYDGLKYEDIYIRIQNEYKYLNNGAADYALIVNKNDGIIVNGVTVSSDAMTYAKILEFEHTFDCTANGNRAILLSCGYTNKSMFSDYTYIWLTLPAFSGMQYKINNSYKYVMPWIKVNGEWKRALQWIKVNGEWKKHNSTWIYNPEA